MCVMGAFFAIQVRTGSEIKAKEMLSFVLRKEQYPHVKGIYALETFTEVINENSKLDEVGTELSNEEIETDLRKKELRSLITNKRRQLEVIKRYNTKMYKQVKETLSNEIRELEKEFQNLTTKKRKIKSVLSGYLLIEIRYNFHRLPEYLFHLIKEVPLVQRVLSLDPIPEHEIKVFAEHIDEVIEPEIEFTLEEDLSEEEILAIQSELVKKLNFNELTKEEEANIIQKIDSVKERMIDKIINFLNQKKEHQDLNKIQIITKRRKNIVHLPLKIFKNICGNKQLMFNKGKVVSRDFLYRLEKIASTA